MDRRRRRLNTSESDSDHSEDDERIQQKSSVRAPRSSECESEIGTERETEQSEYESATEENEDDETETEEETETEYDESVIVEDEEWMEQERQSGDGEETPEKAANLDDDEDRKNPAYIPRKGAFYEHDLRSEDPQAAEEDDKKPKKKLWQDNVKWDHDRYQPHLQAPKSREELIAEYGFDIRAGDGPPAAPPRRGGGRGRRGRPRLGDFMDKRDAGEGYPEDYQDRPRKTYSEMRGNNRRPDNRNQGYQRRDHEYNDSPQQQHHNQHKNYNRSFDRDFPELGSDTPPRDNRGYGNRDKYRERPDYRDNRDRPHEFNQPPPRGYDDDYHRGGFGRRGGGPPRRGGGPGPGFEHDGRGRGGRGRGGPGGPPPRGGRGAGGPAGPRVHHEPPPPRPVEDRPPRHEQAVPKGRDGNLPPAPPPPTIVGREFTNSSYTRGPPPGFPVRDNKTPPGERSVEQKKAIEIVKDISPEPPPVATMTSVGGVKIISGGGPDDSITPPILQQPPVPDKKLEDRRSFQQERRGGRGGARGGGRGGYTQRVEQAMQQQQQHAAAEAGPAGSPRPAQQPAPQTRHPPPGYPATPSPPQMGHRGAAGVRPPPAQPVPPAGAPAQQSPGPQPIRGAFPPPPSPALIQQQQQQTTVKGADRAAGTKRYSSQRQRAAPEAGFQEQQGPQQPPPPQQRVAMDAAPSAAGHPPFYPAQYNVPPPAQGASVSQPTPPGPPPGLFPPRPQDPPPPVVSLSQPPVRGMMQAPVASYSLANVPSSHMGPPQIFSPPSESLPVATVAAPGQQTIIQPAAYIATPVLNYAGGPHPAAVQLSTAAPTHYQIAAAPAHVPLAQTTPTAVVMAAPAPPQPSVPIPTSPTAEPGVEVKGGTTYFSPDMQKASNASEAGPGIQVKGGTTYFSPEFQQGVIQQGRAGGKRPNAAIPIVSPRDTRSGRLLEEVAGDESQDPGARGAFNVLSSEFYPGQQLIQDEEAEDQPQGDGNEAENRDDPSEEPTKEILSEPQRDRVTPTRAEAGTPSEGVEDFQDAQEDRDSEGVQDGCSDPSSEQVAGSVSEETEEAEQLPQDTAATPSDAHSDRAVPDLQKQEAISDNVTNEIIETVTASVRSVVNENGQEHVSNSEHCVDENQSTDKDTNDASKDSANSEETECEAGDKAEEQNETSEPVTSPQPIHHSVQVCFEREVKVVETQPKVQAIEIETKTPSANSECE